MNGQLFYLGAIYRACTIINVHIVYKMQLQNMLFNWTKICYLLQLKNLSIKKSKNFAQMMYNFVAIYMTKTECKLIVWNWEKIVKCMHYQICFLKKATQFRAFYSEGFSAKIAASKLWMRLVFLLFNKITYIKIIICIYVV